MRKVKEVKSQNFEFDLNNNTYRDLTSLSLPYHMQVAYCMQDIYPTNNVKWWDKEALACSSLVKWFFLQRWKNFLFWNVNYKIIKVFFYSQQKEKKNQKVRFLQKERVLSLSFFSSTIRVPQLDSKSGE